MVYIPKKILMTNKTIKNHTVTSNSRKRPTRQYTLNDIRNSIRGQLFLADTVPMRVPAEITLKKWSQAGVFDDAVTLEQAVKLTQKRLSDSNSKGVKGLGTSPASTQSPGQPQFDLIAQQQAFQQTVIAELRVISARLTQIEQSAGSGRSHPQEVGDGAGSAALTKAIDQLDAIRRHIGVRFDNEIQLSKQLNANPAGKSTSNDGSFLELQRIQGRMGRMEDLLQTISAKVQN
jgi:hypothetical protein